MKAGSIRKGITIGGFWLYPCLAQRDNVVWLNSFIFLLLSFSLSALIYLWGSTPILLFLGEKNYLLRKKMF